MRTAYSAIFYLLTPFILLRLLWRGIKAPDYCKRWGERFGCYHDTTRQDVIWIHAVSVGEAEAAFPLIKRLQKNKPHIPILVTTTTPTGSARVKAVLADTVQHVYLPYDLPFVVERFLNSFKPMLAVIMETELWPNLFHGCGIHKIPLCVINARLSEKSTQGYRKLPSLIRPLLANVSQIAAQSQEDAQRFIAIGANPGQVTVAGNIKFDLDVTDATLQAGFGLKTNEFAGRYVWLAASTHRGEEQICLTVYQALKQKIPEILLVLVPRHPERFVEVEELCRSNNLLVITRTSKRQCNQVTDVYLVDTMGELKMLYAAADIAFIGGSLVPVGGHNLLEAAVVGVPVLFGPYMANFKEISEKVLANKAALQCGDQAALIAAIQLIYSDNGYRNALVANGKAFVSQNRGVLDKIYDALVKEISA